VGGRVGGWGVMDEGWDGMGWMGTDDYDDDGTTGLCARKMP